jgi:hypothetical protein
MIKGFNREKCARRNRILAARGTVETSPVRFLRNLEKATGVVDAVGTLPADDDEALAMINAGLPASAKPLTLDEVYIHYIEAASSVLIDDRFARFSTSTLVNIATGAAAGVAFMNSHRTGDVSSPSELPFGRTFAGRYEATPSNGGVGECVYVGFYMLRGIAPNGSGSPTTDDLHRMIDGGTLFDVSVGLYPGKAGKALCDVCGNDYQYECPHLAGTTRNMSDDEIAVSREAGNPDGKASYTYFDFEMGEVSGVYDGAVPGAGFRKGLALMGQLSDEELGEFRTLFRDLLIEPRLDREPGHEPKDTPMENKPKLSLWAGLNALFRSHGLDPDAELVTEAQPVSPKVNAASVAPMAGLLVETTCRGIEPAKQAFAVKLATAALIADGGAVGEHCEAFKAFAATQVSPIDMTAPQLVAQLPATGAALTGIDARREQVLAGAVDQYNKGTR